MKKTVKVSKTNARSILIMLSLFGAVLKTTAQTVSYKVVYDDPMDVPNLFISVSPFYCEASAVGNAANIGFAFQGNYNLGKRLAFEASFANAYLDLNARNNNLVTGTEKPLSKHKQIEGGATFFFRSRLKNKSVQITLAATQSSKSYINAPSTIHAQTGLRGGVFYYNYAIQAEGKDYFTGTNTETKSDTALSEYNYHGISTNMNVAGSYIGLIRRKTVDICIQAAGYGQKSHSKIGEIYADVLFAPVVVYSDVVLTKSNVKYSLSSTASKFIGWRVGYQIFKPKTVGWQARLEFGQKPGWGVKSGYYLLAGWSLTFGIKAKPAKPTTN